MVLLLLLTVLAIGLYWAWDSVRAERAEERQAETAAERGAHLFAQNCRLCHGRTGQGVSENAAFPGIPLNIEPNRPTDAAQLKSLQLRLRDTIRCGRAGTIMPPWHLDYGGSLNDEQIRQLVALITTNAGDAWEKELKYSTELDAQFELPAPPLATDPTQINSGYCGAVAGAATVATPVGEPTEVPPAWIAQGEKVAISFACTSCHTSNGATGVGPTWKELYGSTVTLNDGSTVTADSAYITESIRSPAVKITEGFQAVMPTYTSLSDADINSLAAYIKSLGEQ
ncbi:MAG TPA: c-type cytochrome [Dehalococcoidia bacterium]|nr:c-type cytochrome [Dehalococcoidia bacterium]